MDTNKKLPDNQITVYQTSDGKINIEVLYANENIWLPQKRIAELFDVDRSVVTKHLKNIFSENELQEDSVCANFAHTAEDGKEYQTKFYSLEAIIAVGYRVNSERGTQFRQWAISILQLDHLNRIVSMYLDYAELQAVRNSPMYMKDWIEKLNAFLKFSEYEILTNAGQISHEVALALASKEYERFKKIQDKNYISDFDKEIKRIAGKKDDDE